MNNGPLEAILNANLIHAKHSIGLPAITLTPTSPPRLRVTNHSYSPLALEPS
jgi:hypothetical protein